MIVVLVSCEKSPIRFEFTGKVLEGSYNSQASECGTHTIVNGLNMFILYSDDIDLNLYVNDSVSVFGRVHNCERIGYITVEEIDRL